MSTALDIADAVVALLNGAPQGTFAERFTARRRFVPTFKLETDAAQPPVSDDLSELRVEVIVPPVQTMERVDRATWENSYPIALGLAKKLDPGDDEAREAQMAALLPLVEQIVDYLRDDARIVLADGAVLDRVEPHQNFNAEMFSAHHEYFAVVVLHYRFYR